MGATSTSTAVRRAVGSSRAGRVAFAALAACLLLGLAAPGQAFAGFEWLGTGAGEFPNSDTELSGGLEVAGVATNNATGDLYETDNLKNRVLRFDAEGHLQEAWGWGVGDEKEEYERCGPAAGSSFPTCPGREDHGLAFAGTGVGELDNPGPIAVDQATGDVFVLSMVRPSVKIQEFSADGTPLAEFGEPGNGPGQVGEPFDHGLALDSAGNVYVVATGFRVPTRVVEFEQITPSEHVFARELLGGQIEGAAWMAIDHVGDFVISNGSKIVKYAAANLSSPQWSIPVTEAEGVTADPETGRVFYYAPKENRFHIVSAAGAEEGGFAGAHQELDAEQAVFDPVARLGGRPPGVLYTGEPTNLFTKAPGRGLIFAGSETNPPTVGGEHPAAVGAGFATLAAEVDPESFATTYRFEYGSQGPCRSNPCASAPEGGAGAGSSGSAVPVSVAVSGLAPGTTYHFRIVAENEFGSAPGADATFTTFPSPPGGLPDHRAYELVSPAEKHGGEVFPLDAHVTSCATECEPGANATGMPRAAAPDGESVVYEGLPFQPVPEGGSGGVDENEYLAKRTPSGWVTSFITPSRLSTGTGLGYRAFDETLSAGIIAQHEPALAPAGLAPPNEDLYMQTGGELRPLVSEPPVNPKIVVLTYDGATPDFAHIVFQADGALTRQTAFAPVAPEASEAAPDLYEWTASGVRLVNVLPEDAKAAAGAVLGAGKLNGSTTESAPDYCGAISEDGSRVFWSKLSSGRVSVREDGERTVLIPDSGKFLCASADGSRVLLGDGHIYDLENETRTDLTHGKAGFQGMLGASETLQQVYYVDTAVLPAVNGQGNTSPTLGADNLYLYDASTATTWFIATLSAADNDYGNDQVEGAWEASPSDRKAQVTPDGRFLAFQSFAPLTGANSEPATGPCRMEGAIRRCPDVFEYDATRQTLDCVSCNPAGLAPAGGSILSLISPVSSTFPQPRNLTDDGRLFFDSFDELSVEDAHPGVENVYEHEQAGQGTCTNEAGCTLLISSGQSAFDAGFFSAGSTGRDVFLTTRAQLLPESDHDELVDLYDAREGGGFASESGTSGCSGEGCRPASPAPSAAPPPASSIFSGAGNLTPRSEVKPVTTHKLLPKCHRGTVRKHGRCVRAKHRKKAKRARHAGGRAGASRGGPR